MNNKTKKRILTAFILLLLIIFLPFWVLIILGLLGMFYFHFFFEAVFLFLILDLLYASPEASFLNFPFFSFIISLLTLFLVEFSKKYIRIG